jgi:hypothetical protein|tara:strand:+ start:1261 stop:1461 length:201 start_codon:yes stop_codon:yes gene_type:complete
MKIDLKLVAPYVVMAFGIAMTWGMWSERLDAVERKADTIVEMQKDIAIIKEKIMWMENFLATTPNR